MFTAAYTWIKPRYLWCPPHVGPSRLPWLDSSCLLQVVFLSLSNADSTNSTFHLHSADSADSTLHLRTADSADDALHIGIANCADRAFLLSIAYRADSTLHFDTAYRASYTVGTVNSRNYGGLWTFRAREPRNSRDFFDPFVAYFFSWAILCSYVFVPTSSQSETTLPISVPSRVTPVPTIFLLCNMHFCARHRVPRLLQGEADRKRVPGSSNDARETISFSTRFRIATRNCAGLSNLTIVISTLL